MLFITNHQGNADCNHDEISPHTCQNSSSKRQEITRLVTVEKTDPSTLLVGMYIGVATMKNSMEVPQKT